MNNARGVEGVAVCLVDGEFVPVRVVGIIVAEVGVIVGVVVARLGELMFDIIRELGKAFEPVAKLCFFSNLHH